MDIKSLIKNIDFIKDGTEISNDNLLLKNYDKNNDSIFQRAEIEALKSDIEKAAGEDGQLSENEAAEFLKTGNFIGEKYINGAKDFISASINSIIAKNIASQMHSEIENNFRIGSLSSKKFKECLDRIDSNNIVQVMDEYKKISKAKESLPEAIINEVSNSTEKIREVLDKIFDALILNIDDSNYDIEKLKKEYNEAKKTPQWTDDNEIIDIAYQMAKSDKNITTTEENTVDVVKTRGEKASQTQQDQVNSQGGVSNILDDIAGVFGGLTQEKVDEILKEQQSRAERLNAVKDNPVEFAKLFKEFYGVEYSKTAVANYEKQEELYSQARDKYGTYSFLMENFKDVLEVESFMDKDTNVSKKKMQEIYNKCYELLSSMFGKETIDSILAQSDIGNPPLTSRKYEVLRPLVLEIVKMAEDDWNSFSNGKSLDDFKTERDASYHAAFGYENDALLEAEDWVASQQKRLTAAQVGSMVLSMSAGIMFGGPMALLMGAVSYADPVGLVENATDANGMTKEDWNTYIDSKTDIENLGWMALGIATGGLGNLARSATLLKFVKLKGLKSLLVSSGQNLDDLIKAGKLPKELSTAVESAKKLADVTGFLVEASSDIITTALLQKEGLTSGDWVLSLAGALAGTSLVEGLRTTKNIDEGLSKLKEALPDFNWTKEDATKFMQAIGNKVLELNDKANAWANTPTARSSVAYSSIVPISPVALEKAAKFVTRILTDGINKLFSDKGVSQLMKLQSKNPNLHAALTEAMTEITTRICAGEIPTSNFMNSGFIDEIAAKYGVDPDDLMTEVESFMQDPKWNCIGDIAEQSNKYWSNADHLDEAMSYIAEFRLKAGLYSQEHEEAVLAMFKDLESKILNNEKPSKEMFDSLANKYAGEYNLSVDELIYSMRARMQNSDEWKNLLDCFINNSNNDSVNKAVDSFKKAKGIEEEPKIEAETEKTELEVENVETAKQSEFEITDELIKKYSYLSNMSFFNKESKYKLMEIMEKYEKAVTEGQVNTNDFDTTLLMELIDDVKLNDNDCSIAFDLIKNTFHKGYVEKQLRLNALQSKYPSLSRETIEKTEELALKLEEKMNNGEKITDDELEGMLFNINNNNFAWEDMKKMLYDNPKLQNWLNDCTHKDVYNNPKYTGPDSYYTESNIEEALGWFDEILNRINNGEDLTPEMIKEYTNNMNYSFSDELLIDIIQNHWKLGPLYKEIS